MSPALHQVNEGHGAGWGVGSVTSALPQPSQSHRPFKRGHWDHGRRGRTWPVSSKARTTRLSLEPRLASVGKLGPEGGPRMGPLHWTKHEVAVSSPPGAHGQAPARPCPPAALCSQRPGFASGPWHLPCVPGTSLPCPCRGRGPPPHCAACLRVCGVDGAGSKVVAGAQETGSTSTALLGLS